MYEERIRALESALDAERSRGDHLESRLDELSKWIEKVEGDAKRGRVELRNDLGVRDTEIITEAREIEEKLNRKIGALGRAIGNLEEAASKDAATINEIEHDLDQRLDAQSKRLDALEKAFRDLEGYDAPSGTTARDRLDMRLSGLDERIEKGIGHCAENIKDLAEKLRAVLSWAKGPKSVIPKSFVDWLADLPAPSFPEDKVESPERPTPSEFSERLRRLRFDEVENILRIHDKAIPEHWTAIKDILVRLTKIERKYEQSRCFMVELHGRIKIIEDRKPGDDALACETADRLNAIEKWKANIGDLRARVDEFARQVDGRFSGVGTTVARINQRRDMDRSDLDRFILTTRNRVANAERRVKDLGAKLDVYYPEPVKGEEEILAYNEDRINELDKAIGAVDAKACQAAQMAEEARETARKAVRNAIDAFNIAEGNQGTIAFLDTRLTSRLLTLEGKHSSLFKRVNRLDELAAGRIAEVDEKTSSKIAILEAALATLSKGSGMTAKRVIDLGKKVDHYLSVSEQYKKPGYIEGPENGEKDIASIRRKAQYGGEGEANGGQADEANRD